MRSPSSALAYVFLFLALLLTFSYAQQTQPPSNDFDSMVACMKCLSKAGLAQVPACSTLQDNPATSGIPIEKLTNIQLQCYCGLISATEWTSTCSGPQQQCNATIVDTFLQGFAYAKPYVCTSKNLSGQTSGAQKGQGQGRGWAVVLFSQVTVWMTVLVLNAISAPL